MELAGWVIQQNWPLICRHKVIISIKICKLYFVFEVYLTSLNFDSISKGNLSRYTKRTLPCAGRKARERKLIFMESQFWAQIFSSHFKSYTSHFGHNPINRTHGELVRSETSLNWLLSIIRPKNKPQQISY